MTDTLPDPILPALTRAQAVRFHERVQAAFNRRGLNAVYQGDDAYLVGDDVFGVSNLSVAVAGEDESEWDRLMDRHFDALLAQLAQRLEPATTGQIYLRVRPSRKDEAEDYPCRGIVDGMEVVFAVDYPQYVSEIGDAAALAALGSVDDLWPVAMANLRALPAPEHEVIDLVDEEPDNFPLHVFFCDDYFGASRILFVDEVVDAVLGAGFSSEHGLLVAIPHRHLLLVYVVEDSQALIGCSRLVSIVQDQFDTSAGAVTSSVFYRGTDGSLTEVAYLTEDGRAYVNPTAEMAAHLFPTNE